MDEHDYRSLDESLEEKKRNSSVFSDQNKKPFDEVPPRRRKADFSAMPSSK